MREAGFTRHWRYMRDRLSWRRDLAEVRGLRWCLLCGRDLHEDAKLSALYCSDGCRANARRKRRARGVHPGWIKHPVLVANKRDLDARALERTRAESFYLVHGKTIDRASEILPRWGEGPRDA